MKKIIYKTETGISIIHPTGEVDIDILLEKDVPKQYQDSAVIVDSDIIPDDREFRNAWELKSKKININIDKAKDIKKDKLRADRKPLFEEQDALYMIAFENNSDASEIINEKKRLRDITKEVDKCKTIDAIKNVIC